jgi:hypothetical protein
MSVRPNPFVNGKRVKSFHSADSKTSYVAGVYMLYRIERNKKHTKRSLVSVSHAMTGALQFVDIANDDDTVSYDLCYVPFMQKLDGYGDVVLTVKKSGIHYHIYSQSSVLPEWLTQQR